MSHRDQRIRSAPARTGEDAAPRRDRSCHAAQHEAELRAFDAPLRAAAVVGRGDRVLEIGCGTGRSTRDAAHVAAPGRVLDIDTSAPSLERAHRLSAAERLDNTGLPIGRNVALLSAAVAANASMLQLTSAVAAISLARLLDVEGLLGLGPAIVFAAGALAAVPAGRAMDRRGRIPVLAAGFALGAASCGLAALGSAYDSAVVVLVGLIGVGIANGAARLIRTAGGDMYPPERRARGIALVLFGAVFGAILGPAVFAPLLAGRELDGDTLASLWLAGGAFALVALALVAAVRPDPKAIASLLGHEPPAPTRPAAPLGDLLRRPGVVPALVAAQMGVGVMVGVMSLIGPVVVDHFGHEHHDVFPIIGAQLLGMYALVLVVGGLVDRIGRAQSLSGGLLLMGLSVSSLLWLESAHATAAALFGHGLGWNVSFVAATTERTDRTQSWERGRLLGFNDLLSGATGAALTLLGGLALSRRSRRARDRGDGAGRRPRALDPARRERAATPRTPHNRLPQEDAMQPHLIMIPADQKVADMHRCAERSRRAREVPGAARAALRVSFVARPAPAARPCRLRAAR